MDLAYSKEHINTFAIVSGDSDFSPLVSKLKELGKHVIGLGMQESTSDLLRDNCDEFIYYEDLGRPQDLPPVINAQLPEMKRKAFGLLLESLLALRRENKEVLWSSMVKDTMKRKKPSFNEAYHGYKTFSQLLEDAQKEGLVEIETDKRSRTYVVTRFAADQQYIEEGGEAPRKKPSRRRRAGGSRRAAPMPDGTASARVEDPRLEEPRLQEPRVQERRAEEPRHDVPPPPPRVMEDPDSELRFPSAPASSRPLPPDEEITF